MVSFIGLIANKLTKCWFVWFGLLTWKTLVLQIKVLGNSSLIYTFYIKHFPFLSSSPQCVFWHQWRRSVLESERREDADERRTARNMETSTGKTKLRLAWVLVIVLILGFEYLQHTQESLPHNWVTLQAIIFPLRMFYYLPFQNGQLLHCSNDLFFFRLAFTCAFCKFRTFEDKDIEKHFGSTYHQETLDYIRRQAKLDDRVISFLHVRLTYIKYT